MAYTLRLNLQLAPICFYEGLGNHQAKPNPLMVHLCRAEQFAELFAESGHFFLHYSYSSIDHFDDEHGALFVVGGKNLHGSLASKFDRVFDQVKQNLLQSHLVTQEELW